MCTRQLSAVEACLAVLMKPGVVEPSAECQSWESEGWEKRHRLWPRKRARRHPFERLVRVKGESWGNAVRYCECAGFKRRLSACNVPQCPSTRTHRETVRLQRPRQCDQDSFVRGRYVRHLFPLAAPPRPRPRHRNAPCSTLHATCPKLGAGAPWPRATTNFSHGGTPVAAGIPAGYLHRMCWTDGTKTNANPTIAVLAVVWFKRP
jgi:hypothetical protein